MDPAPPPEAPAISKTRLEGLVDAIYAFAMTLLVLGFAVPALAGDEAERLLPGIIAGMLPEFINYLVAFLVLTSFWIAHHHQFRHVHASDHGLVWTTVLSLVFVVLVPFTTSLSGDYTGVMAAVDLFHGNLLAIGLAFLLQWHYLVHHPVLTSGPLGPGAVRAGYLSAGIVPALSLLAMAVALVSPAWSMAMYLLTPVLHRLIR